MKKILLFAAVLATTSLFAADGATLTKSCVGCHGANFSKAPLGKSNHIIKGSKENIAKRIKYYQNPEESDEMIMKAQVKRFSDAQINTVAEYIFNHLSK